MEDNTPPPVPGPSGNSTIHRRSRLEGGKIKRRNNTQHLKSKIKELGKKLKNAKMSIGKYKQKLHRIDKKT